MKIMKTWYTLFITVFAITQIRSGTIPLESSGYEIKHPIRRQVLLTYPLGTMLTINGNRLCGGTDETIIEYIPFDENNPDRVDSIKTESDPDNREIDNHAPVVLLTNVQILNFENTRREGSNRTKYLPNEEHLPNNITVPNDEHSNSSCDLDVTNHLRTKESVVQQSAPTEKKSIFVTDSSNISNISMVTRPQTSAGMEKNRDMSTNKPSDRNDSHVLTTSTLQLHNEHPHENPCTLNNYHNETIHNVTTPSYGTNHSIPGNQHMTTSTQRSFEDLPDLSTYDPIIVGMIHSTTPKNCTQSTTKLTTTKIATETPTSAGMEKEWDMSTNKPNDRNDSHVLTTRTLQIHPDKNPSTLNNYHNKTIHIVTTPSYGTNHSIPGNQHMTISTQRSFEDLPDLSTYDPIIVGMIHSTTPKNCTQSTSTTKLTTTEANHILQHVKPENKSSNYYIINHHTHRRLIIRVS